MLTLKIAFIALFAVCLLGASIALLIDWSPWRHFRRGRRIAPAEPASDTRNWSGAFMRDVKRWEGRS